MDQEKIKKALDHFENDEYVDAKEILSKEIKGGVEAHLKDKLGLKGDINPAPEKKEDGDNEED